MIFRMYSLRDARAGTFTAPFFFVNDMLALRQCEQMVEDSQSIFATHAPDFSLYFVGEFDDANGMVAPMDPTIIVNLSELRDRT